MQRFRYSQPRHWKVVRVAGLTFGRRYPGTHFRRLSEPQDQHGHETAKKSLYPSAAGDPTPADQPVAKRLAA